MRGDFYKSVWFWQWTHESAAARDAVCICRIKNVASGRLDGFGGGCLPQLMAKCCCLCGTCSIPVRFSDRDKMPGIGGDRFRERAR